MKKNNYYSVGNCKVILTEKRYNKIGNQWKLMEEKQPEEIPEENYNNIVSAETLRFFRSLGGYERIEKGYTSAGYYPIRSISISPDRKKRVVRDFEII